MATDPVRAGLDASTAHNRLARRYYLTDLKKYGVATHDAILRASPELKKISKFLDSRFSGKIPQDMLEGYQDSIRSAQAARGFGGGGTGVTGEEARYLTGLQEAQRMQLLPFMQSFGQSVLGMAGLGGANTVSGQEALNMWSNYKQVRLAEAQFRHQKTMSYVNTALTAVSALTGGVGAIAGAAVQYQQNRAMQMQNQYAPQLYQSGVNALQGMYQQPQQPPTVVGASGLIGSPGLQFPMRLSY